MKVEIIPRGAMSNTEFSKVINDKLSDIEENSNVINTHFGFNHDGLVSTMVIEYEDR